jgi:acetyl esterase/lipase
MPTIRLRRVATPCPEAIARQMVPPKSIRSAPSSSSTRTASAYELSAGIVLSVHHLARDVAGQGPGIESPAPVNVTRHRLHREARGGRAGAYVPVAKTTKRPVILLVHGGAWHGGDKSDFVDHGMALAQPATSPSR